MLSPPHPCSRLINGGKMGLGCRGMGRLPLALGTAGAIRFYKTDTGCRARVLVRDYDGQVRALERRAPNKTAAERALKLALRDRASGQARGEITADSRVSVLAEAWHASLADLSPMTLQAYRDRLDRQLLHRLGQLRVRELSVGTLRSDKDRLRLTCCQPARRGVVARSRRAENSRQGTAQRPNSPGRRCVRGPVGRMATGSRPGAHRPSRRE